MSYRYSITTTSFVDNLHGQSCCILTQLYLASSSSNILSFRLLLLAVAAAAAVIEKRTTQKAIEQAQQGSGVATSESTSER